VAVTRFEEPSELPLGGFSLLSESQHVPRVSDMTGNLPADNLRRAKDWNKANRELRADVGRYARGSQAEKDAWLRRIRQTRSF
jgi:hypothetical protein